MAFFKSKIKKFKFSLKFLTFVIFQAVCSRILEHWNSLTLFFQQEVLEEDLPTAKNILGALCNPIFKMYLCFLEFNLDQVTNLNIELQSEKPKFPVLLTKMTLLLKNTMSYFIKNDILNKTSLFSINVNNPNNYKDINNIYFGGKVDAFLKNETTKEKISTADWKSFEVRCLDFYVELVNQIKKRFDFNNQHLKFASLFVPQKILTSDTFAISEFSFLFPCLNTLDIDRVNFEWQNLKTVIEDVYVCGSGMDIETFWIKISKLTNELGEQMFPNLLQIVKCLFCIPHSSAAAERIFSQLSLVKTKLRNQLLVETVSNILLIKQHILQHGSLNIPKNHNFYKSVIAEHNEHIAF